MVESRELGRGAYGLIKELALGKMTLTIMLLVDGSRCTFFDTYFYAAGFSGRRAFTGNQVAVNRTGYWND